MSLVLIGALGASAAAQPGPRPAGPARPPAGPRPQRSGKPVKVDVAKAGLALVGPDLALAAVAAAQLGSSPVEGAHDLVLDALATGLHPDVAVAAITGLATTATKTDLGIIGTFTRSRHPAVRAAAVRGVLAATGDPATVTAALSSFDQPVRTAAAEAAGRLRLTDTIPALLILLDKGEDAAAVSLGTMANEALARTIAEHFGTAPDATLAKALGAMLARPEFGPEPTRLEAVRAVNKLAGPEAIAVLEAYLKATPATPPRLSRREAEAGLKAKLGGGK